MPWQTSALQTSPNQQSKLYLINTHYNKLYSLVISNPCPSAHASSLLIFQSPHRKWGCQVLWSSAVLCIYLSIFLGYWATAGGARGLLLALCWRITPGLRDQTRIDCKQGEHLIPVWSLLATFICITECILFMTNTAMAFKCLFIPQWHIFYPHESSTSTFSFMCFQMPILKKKLTTENTSLNGKQPPLHHHSQPVLGQDASKIDLYSINPFSSTGEALPKAWLSSPLSPVYYRFPSEDYECIPNCQMECNFFSPPPSSYLTESSW